MSSKNKPQKQRAPRHEGLNKTLLSRKSGQHKKSEDKRHRQKQERELVDAFKENEE